VDPAPGRSRQPLSRFEWVATLAACATGLGYAALAFVLWFTELGSGILDVDRGAIASWSLAAGWLLVALAVRWDELSIPRGLLLAAGAIGAAVVVLTARSWWTGDGAGWSLAHGAALPTFGLPLVLVIGAVRRGPLRRRDDTTDGR
jgi:hypothetical protein